MEATTDRGDGREVAASTKWASSRGPVQGWFQGRLQPLHDGSQGCGGQFVFLDEGLPQRLPRRIVRELVREADRKFGGHGHAAPLEGRLDRLGQQVGVETFAFQQH